MRFYKTTLLIELNGIFARLVTIQLYNLTTSIKAFLYCPSYHFSHMTFSSEIPRNSDTFYLSTQATASEQTRYKCNLKTTNSFTIDFKNSSTLINITIYVLKSAKVIGMNDLTLVLTESAKRLTTIPRSDFCIFRATKSFISYSKINLL